MGGERTSVGIQAERASVMRSFAYLDDTEDGLSIRDWVANERDDSWLFITVKADQLPSLRPRITVWLDIAISAIMSLSPDRDRRLYCVIDERSEEHTSELQSLMRISYAVLCLKKKIKIIFTSSTLYMIHV